MTEETKYPIFKIEEGQEEIPLLDKKISKLDIVESHYTLRDLYKVTTMAAKEIKGNEARIDNLNANINLYEAEIKKVEEFMGEAPKVEDLVNMIVADDKKGTDENK